MIRSRTVLVLGLLVAVLGSRWAEAAPCYMDAKGNGTGLPLKWPKMPINYYINASQVPAADKAAFMDAVRAAFTSWTKVSCTDIQFVDKGESTSVASKSLGGMLVYFQPKDNGSLYWTQPGFTSFDPPDITDALIQLNLTVKSGSTTFGLSVGAQPDKYDVQTLVKNLIPMALGFCVETAVVAGKTACVLPAADNKPNYVNPAISADEQTGAQYLYFKADSGCTQPTKPAACPTDATAGDGPKREAGVTPHYEKGTQPISDGAVKDRGTVGLEHLPPATSDKGCCRVSHAADSSGQGLLALAGLALLLALHRRRQG